MKRAFANIGFTFAVTLIILNFLNVNWALAAFVAVSVLFVIFIGIKKTRHTAALPLSMLSAALACFIFIVNYNNVVLPQLALDQKTVNARIYITDLEQKTSSGYSYTVKTDSIDLQNSPQNIKLTVFSKERITCDSYEIINTNLSLYSAGENAFDSRGSYAKGVFLRGYINSYQPAEESVSGIETLNKKVIQIRKDLQNKFSDLVDGDAGALSLAMLTGDTNTLSNEAYNNFKSCGATHLMAVSGFNLAVFTGVLYKLLRRLLCPKIPLIIVCSGSVIFYVMLAGFSASMVRASIMMLIFLFSKLFKEKADNLNSLGFSAFIVCLNPYAVSDAGALLTFTAALGLVVLSPYLTLKFKTKFKPLKSLADIITASVCVFITSFPVMYFMFGEVSIIGLLLNVVLIPLSEILMINSIVLSFAPAFLIKISIFIAKAVGGLMLRITNLCAGFSFSTINIGSNLYAVLIFCVFVIFSVAFIIKAVSDDRVFKQCTVISCIFAVIITAVNIAEFKTYTYLRVMRGEYSNAVIVYNDDNALVFGITEYDQYYKAKEIIESNKLYTAMIIDYDGKYSARLAEDCGCLNYVSDYDVSGYELDNTPIITTDFNETLWENTEISYCSYEGSKTVSLKINNTYFEFSDSMVDESEKYDIIYTVNENGYDVKGVNKWAE